MTRRLGFLPIGHLVVVVAIVLLGMLVPISAPAVGATATAPPQALADGCYTWNRTLRSGSTGSDVAELQIRVAGWVGFGEVLEIDGIYGPATTAAVRRFQDGYGLAADGIAGPNTFGKIYELQDNDCTPLHFSFQEVGNPVACPPFTAAQIRSNLIRSMWKAEALRRKLGDNPLVVTSGLRCSSLGQGHRSGNALDLISNHVSLCRIALDARYAGFLLILGPGYPGHDDHVHVETTSPGFWRAPACGISRGADRGGPVGEAPR